MSDPAIEAAQRALDGMPMLGEASATQAALKALVLDVGTAAAREMAKSVQELHDRWNAIGILPPEAWQILDQLAPLIFTAEELE